MYTYLYIHMYIPSLLGAMALRPGSDTAFSSRAPKASRMDSALALGQVSTSWDRYLEVQSTGDLEPDI